MLHVQRLTIITPEFSEPLINIETKIESKIKAFKIMSAGICKYTCILSKDVLYPKDVLKLTIDIDNTKCTKKIDFIKFKIVRRT